MPLTHLLDPEGSPVTFEDAPAYFDDAGVMPAEAVQNCIDDAKSYSRAWPYMAPSNANPDKNCRRKLVLQRCFGYGEAPAAAAARIEGTFNHKMYEETQPKWLKGWHREITLPTDWGTKPAEGQYLEDAPLREISVADDSPRGWKKIRQIELFPGFWTRMRLDRASPDWTTIIDHKFPKWPWTPKYKGDPYKGKALEYENNDARSDWPIQLSCYARGIKLLYGVDVKEAFVWRTCRGGALPEAMYRKIPVRLLSEDELWRRIKGHVLSTVEYLEGARQIIDEYEEGSVEQDEALKQHCNGVPLDGQEKNLFNGWLCREGCPMKELCFDMAGMMRF